MRLPFRHGGTRADDKQGRRFTASEVRKNSPSLLPREEKREGKASFGDYLLR